MLRLAIVLSFLFINFQAQADTTAGLKFYEQGHYSKAVSELTPLAKEGDPIAQLYMGHIYREGQGEPLNYKQSAYWYLQAAKQGNTKAQSFMGLYFADGIGVKQDFQLASHWLGLAAKARRSRGSKQSRQPL